MTGVELDHGVDFSDGIPAAYGVLAALLNAVIEGIQPDFAVVKLEGDAVFAAAPRRARRAGRSRPARSRSMYRSFADSRHQAIPSADHVCTACPTVAHLDLKAVLHRGHVGPPDGRCRKRPPRPVRDGRAPAAEERRPQRDRKSIPTCS